MYSINGAIFNTNKLNISIQNRAFNYGDGVFETIKVKNKSILFAENHFDRLQLAVKTLSIQININDIRQWVTEFINVTNISNGVIKINVTREEGGLFSPIGNNSEVLIRGRQSLSTSTYLDNVGVYTNFEKAFSSTSPFKTTSCIDYVKAGLYKQENQYDDLILINTKNEVVECLYSNLIWIKDEQWFSPSLETGCIGGVMLNQIEVLLKTKNIVVTKVKSNLEGLLKADYIFNSNVMGLKYLTKITDKNFGSSHPIVNELQIRLT